MSAIDKLRERIEKTLGPWPEFLDLEEAVLDGRKKLEEARMEGKEIDTKKFAKSLVKDKLSSAIEGRHPIFSKAFAALRARMYDTPEWKNLVGDVERLLAASEREYDEKVDELKYAYKNFRSWASGKVLELLLKEKGLRSCIRPGGVAESEAPNLYYGERISREFLAELSLQLLDSLSIGRTMSIFLQGGQLGERLIRSIKELVGIRLREEHVTREDSLRKLLINPRYDGPYTILAKFLLWIYKGHDLIKESEVVNHLGNIVRDLQEAYGLLFYLPRGDREKWSTFLIPRLTTFVSKWLVDSEKRSVLERFYSTTQQVYKRVWREEKGILQVLGNCVEMFSKTLIETGFISWESLRRIISIIIGLSTKYEFSVPLSVCKSFEQEA